MLIVERAILKYQLREAANQPVETVSKLRKPLNPKAIKTGVKNKPASGMINPNVPTKTSTPQMESIVMRGVLMEARGPEHANRVIKCVTKRRGGPPHKGMFDITDFGKRGVTVTDPHGAEQFGDDLLDGKVSRKGLRKAMRTIKSIMHSDSAVMRGSLKESEQLAKKIKQAGVDAFGRATKGNLRANAVAGVAKVAKNGLASVAKKAVQTGAPAANAAKRVGEYTGAPGMSKDMMSPARKAISSLF